MAAKPTFMAGSRPARVPPLADAPTDGFPAEEDVSIPPTGSDQEADQGASADPESPADRRMVHGPPAR